METAKSKLGREDPRAQLHITHRNERSSEECRNYAALPVRAAATANDLHEYNRYLRIGDGWLALAEMQEWLEGKIPPFESEKPGAH